MNYKSDKLLIAIAKTFDYKYIYKIYLISHIIISFQMSYFTYWFEIKEITVKWVTLSLVGNYFKSSN